MDHTDHYFIYYSFLTEKNLAAASTKERMPYMAVMVLYLI